MPEQEFPERGTVILETPRLLLRTFQSSDIPLLAKMNADPEVMRWLGGPMTPERTRERALATQARVTAGRTGMLPVERRGVPGIRGAQPAQLVPGGHRGGLAAPA